MVSAGRLKESTKNAAADLLRRGGYQLQRIDRTPRAQFAAEAWVYSERRRGQTIDNVEQLKARYRDPVLGNVHVWEAVEMLGHVIDRMDRFLMNVSQEVHALQVVEGMIAEGVDDESLLLTAVIHDVGKVLYLFDEDPANISGPSQPLIAGAPGIGLDQCVFQWSSDEFLYTRLEDHVPDHVGWLLRYHSIVPETCVHLMDDRDRDYFERYWRDFSRLDHATKSTYEIPRTRISDYRDLVDAAFPNPIPF